MLVLVVKAVVQQYVAVIHALERVQLMDHHVLQCVELTLVGLLAVMLVEHLRHKALGVQNSVLLVAVVI